MANILIIDDDKMMGDMLLKMVTRMDHEADCAYSYKEGLDAFKKNSYDAVFLNVRLPDGNGLDMLKEIRSTNSTPEVIIITAEGDPDGAELAIRNGAWDYIEKPSSIDKMSLPLIRALQFREEKNQRKPLLSLKRDAIIGNSPLMQTCMDSIAHAASTHTPVFITGETGTGKELIAWAIHENSSRSKANFVIVDCASLPENLVESSLFGYKKGAFTGADKDMEGLIKQADGGTLFLDEIGELPLNLQKSFLRVLQEHRFRPIGSKTEIQSDFRVLAASNKNLNHLSKNGQFRSDLLFRLQSITIELPPLRLHKEDMKDMIVHYISKLCERYNIESKGFSPEFLEVLSSYDWPGNVRELINTIEWAISAAQDDPTLYQNHLPPHIRIKLARASVNKPSQNKPAPQVSTESSKKTQTLQQVRNAAIAGIEKEYLQELMTNEKNDIKTVCHLSGLSRPRLYALLKKYNISKR